MSAIFNSRVISPVPADYKVPGFPSLYWPFPIDGPQTRYLYHTSDIWRFTLYWTLIFYGALHTGAAVYAVGIQAFGNILEQKRSSGGVADKWKVIWIIPVAFLLFGAVEGLVAGSIVGGLLGAIYNAGYFRMSTWIPFVWALINSLIVVLSSFAIHGGL